MQSLTREEYTQLIPQIDTEKCCGDALCVNACVRHCLVMNTEGKAQYKSVKSSCFQCGHCLAICPTKAISFQKVAFEDIPKGEVQVNPADFQHLIKMRRTMREFKQEPIPLVDIEKALDAVRFAPTAVNTQSVSWTLLDDTKKVHELGELTAKVLAEALPESPFYTALYKAFEKGRNPISYNAPQIIFAHGPKEEVSNFQNTVIAISYLELLFTSMNIGTCWAGYIMKAANMSNEINTMLNLPSSHAIGAALLIGYSNKKYKRSVMRKALDLQVL